MGRSDMSFSRKHKMEVAWCFGFHSPSETQIKFLCFCKCKYDRRAEFFSGGEGEHWENFINNVDNNTGQNGSRFVTLHSLSLLWDINSLPTKWLMTTYTTSNSPFLPFRRNPSFIQLTSLHHMTLGKRIRIPSSKDGRDPSTANMVIPHAWHVAQPKKWECLC